jgi:arylsulfatase A-like enzyme
MYRNKTRIDEPAELTYVTDDLTTAALNFIKENKDNPFFIYLAYNAPHTPNEAKKEHLKKLDYIKDWRRKSYAAMTISMDENVGRITNTLKELDIEEKTLVVFVNDNGGATNNGSDNGQYRGMKGSKWEGGVRVPFIFTWPGTLPEGTTYDQPISALDLLPTSLALGGGTWNSDKKLDGVNLIPYLQGKDKTPPHEILFWRRGVAAAVRKGKWKLIRSTGNPNLLFDLDADISETTNLADKHPDVVKELLAALEDWESELAPPKWKEGQKWQNFQVKKHRMEVNTRELERKYP